MNIYQNVECYLDIMEYVTLFFLNVAFAILKTDLVNEHTELLRSFIS